MTNRSGESIHEGHDAFGEFLNPISEPTKDLPTLVATAAVYRLPLTMGIRQACGFVGIGKTKMQELINRGEVSTAKVDGRTLVLTDSVISLVERNRVARGQ